ncbi:carboxypeptidase-like regulatory domain-containing protein [Salegentibacter sp. F188]|uniref:Carboxypeptidase-like regulatory domain-containing protein n=1 Tax=Autumnicola patrickiae TaxID=3075591 RepID=A0ABU3E566_9FLAO|nr:carboxypeptidase-like regulatory domain-containing protein [Salegentibacter sp. F188]MDT0691126.1 carboxypeptidase-like regulatory domain-containing protein [Salegentibacter sp. F188]
MGRSFFYFFFFLFFVQLSSAQEISAQLLDRVSKQPVPYATIQYGTNKGVVTNDEGIFSIPSEGTDATISISSLGYETVEVDIVKIKGIIYLEPQSIQLSDIFLSDKNLTGKEIIERVIASVDSNYNFNLTKKRFFFRRSYFNKINQLDLEVENSTIAELDQNFMNEVVDNIPHYADSYNEYFGDFYGNYDKQKVQLIKAAKLDNPVNEESLEEITGRMEKIFQKKIGEGTYVKIKSGIIGVKVDGMEFQEEISETNEAAKPKIKTPEELEKEKADKQKEVQAVAGKFVQRQLRKMFWNEDNTFDVFEKARKYRFAVDGYAQLDNSVVYVISFEPKRGADFKGKIYVNTEDFGVHRLDYENVKAISSFKLFGISTKDDVYRGKMIFSRGMDGKYNPKYLEQEDGTTVGIDRPLTMMVKKGNFLWNKKLDELDMEIRLSNSDISKFELVVYEDDPLEESDYESFQISDNYEYQVFKKYNPDFWNGYNIIEPNAAIKAFTALEETTEL